MNVSAIGCTSIRPNETSFKARRHSDEGYAHKHNPGEAVKKVLVAASVITAGTLATKSLSGRLLDKLTKNTQFADKVGKKSLEAFQFVEAKIGKLDADNKVQGFVKKYADKAIDLAKKVASKGLDEDVASDVKAQNGIKKVLTWAAGGSAGIAAAKDSDADGHMNVKDLAGNVLINVIDAAG